MDVSAQDLLDVLNCLSREHNSLLTRKSYVLRHLLSCLTASTSTSSRLAEIVYAYHAPAIVAAWLDAALAVAADTCLLSDLGTLAATLCLAQPPLAIMLAEALIVSCCISDAGQVCSVHPAALQLLPPLLEDYPDAAALAAHLLLTYPNLCTGLAASLTEALGNIDYVASVLRLLSSVFKHPSSAAAQLRALVGRPTFAQAASVLSAIASATSAATTSTSFEPLRAACLCVLSILAASGCMLLEGSEACTHDSGVGGVADFGDNAIAGASCGLARIASNLLAGTKPCLMSSDMSLRLQAAQVLSALCAACHPLLLQQLMSADLVEYLCECVRSHAGPLLGSSKAQQQQSSSTLVHKQIAELQAAVVGTLRFLSLEGSLFQQHMVYGLDTLIRLCHGAVASGDTPLLADLLSLLVTTVSHNPDQEGPLVPLTDILKAVQLLPPIFPGPMATGGGPILLSVEGSAACVCACQLLGSACGMLGKVEQGTQDARNLQLHLTRAVQGCLQGLPSVATPGLPPYLSAACTAIQTWVDQTYQHQITNLQQLLMVLDPTCSCLVPSLLRIYHEVGDCNALTAGLSALMAIIRVTTSEAAPVDVQLAGRGVCTNLLSLKFTSICCELLAVLPPNSTSMHLSVWGLLLLIQQGAPTDCPEPLQLLPPKAENAFQAAVRTLDSCKGLQSAIQLIVMHGSSVFAPCHNAPMAILASALQHDDMVAEPTCILQAMLAVCGSCVTASCIGDASVLAAAISLYIMVEDMQAQTGPNPVPHQISDALQQYVQLQPGCMELGSRLADWVLAHCQGLDNIASAALKQWLLDASQVSHSTRQRVFNHLCGMMAAYPHTVVLVNNMLLHFEAAGDTSAMVAVLDLIIVWQQHSAPQASATLFHQGILQFCSRQALQHRSCAAPASVLCMTKLVHMLQHVAAWAGSDPYESFCAQEHGTNTICALGGRARALALQEIIVLAARLSPYMLDAPACCQHLCSDDGACMVVAFLDLVALASLFAFADPSGVVHGYAADLLHAVEALRVDQLLLDLLMLPRCLGRQPDGSGLQQQIEDPDVVKAVQCAALQLKALTCLLQSMHLLPESPKALPTASVSRLDTTAALLAAVYAHTDLAKANLLHILWTGAAAAEADGLSGVILMQLQNAAVDGCAHIRTSGLMGICSGLQALDLAPDGWSPQVLNATLSHLCSLHASYSSSARAMSSAFRDPIQAEAPLLLRMLPALLLALRFLSPDQQRPCIRHAQDRGQVQRQLVQQLSQQGYDNNTAGSVSTSSAIDGGHLQPSRKGPLPDRVGLDASASALAGSAAAAEVQQVARCRAMGRKVPSWVAAAFASVIDRPNNSLLPLLLDPPPALAHWVHALNAFLVEAGLLHAHMPRMQEAYRAAAWHDLVQQQGTQQQGMSSFQQLAFDPQAVPAQTVASHGPSLQTMLLNPDTQIQDTQPILCAFVDASCTQHQHQLHAMGNEVSGATGRARPALQLLLCSALPLSATFQAGIVSEGAADRSVTSRVILHNMGLLVFLSAWAHGKQPYGIPALRASELLELMM